MWVGGVWREERAVLTDKFLMSSFTTVILLNLKKRVVKESNLYTTSGICESKGMKNKTVSRLVFEVQEPLSDERNKGRGGPSVNIKYYIDSHLSIEGMQNVFSIILYSSLKVARTTDGYYA